MNKITTRLFLLTVTLYGVLFLLASCAENDCSITRRPAARFTFYTSETEPKAIVYPYDTLTVKALRPAPLEDTLLLNRITSADYISLPLTYTGEETTFVLLYSIDKSSYYDTIRVTHTNIPTFISMDCGRDMFFYINNIYSTNNQIDSIKVIDPDIRDHEKENIRIYFNID